LLLWWWWGSANAFGAKVMAQVVEINVVFSEALGFEPLTFTREFDVQGDIDQVKNAVCDVMVERFDYTEPRAHMAVFAMNADAIGPQRKYYQKLAPGDVALHVVVSNREPLWEFVDG
jgi:hypothetical protein